MFDASTALFLLIYFLLGTAIGSFLNVWSRRLLRGQSPTGRSRCEHCGKVISPWDLIPLVSFALLRGRCRYCGKPLSFQYPLVELGTGLLFIFVLILTDYNFLLSIPLLVSLSALFVVFITDLAKHVVFDQTLLVAFAGAFFYRILNRGFTNYHEIGFDLLGALGFWALLWLIRFLTKGKGMGEGDPPLAFIGGFLVGYPAVIAAAFMTFTVGGLAGAILVLGFKKGLKSKIAFGPFLVTGTVLALFLGDPLLDWYLGFLGI